MQFAGSMIGGTALQLPAANRVQQGSEDPAPCSMQAPTRTLSSTMPKQRQAPAQQKAIQQETLSNTAEPVRRTLPSLRSRENSGDPPLQGSLSGANSGSLCQHVHAAAHADLVPAKHSFFAASSSILESVQHAQSQCDESDQTWTHQQQASRDNPRSSDDAAHAHPFKPPKPHAQKPAAKDLHAGLVADAKLAAASQLDVASKPAVRNKAAEAGTGAAQTLNPAGSRLTRLSGQAGSGSADVDKRNERTEDDHNSSSSSEGAYSFQESSDEECDAGSDSPAVRGKGANRQTVAQLKAR